MSKEKESKKESKKEVKEVIKVDTVIRRDGSTGVNNNSTSRRYN
tara:strand:- start:254 stop:385 length:132 start_codon:yes stop_codon:yes gene_type:complete